MECTSTSDPFASSPTTTFSSASLLAAFTQIPDPRRAASVVYPLASLLALAATAMLANQRSVLAIADTGTDSGSRANRHGNTYEHARATVHGNADPAAHQHA